MTSKKKLLIVDDSEISVSYFEGLFSSEFYCCEHAYDGYVALDLCKDTQFDLVISDIHMPMLDGIEFVSLLRDCNGYGQTPIILISADRTVLDKGYLASDAHLSWWSKDLQDVDLNELVNGLLTKSITSWQVDFSC